MSYKQTQTLPRRWRREKYKDGSTHKQSYSSFVFEVTGIRGREGGKEQTNQRQTTPMGAHSLHRHIAVTSASYVTSGKQVHYMWHEARPAPLHSEQIPDTTKLRSYRIVREGRQQIDRPEWKSPASNTFSTD